ncbi:MAG: NAD(P)H-binding protein [Nocardioidaceae bacterium]
MRILVAGATGYVGSRLVPELLARGHEIIAASSSEPDPDRFAWGEEVESAQMDVLDYAAVAEVSAGVDAVCYLVHSLDIRDFTSRDGLAATNVRAAAEANGVRRIVYLSGLVPDEPRADLSEHIASRLEVEDILCAGEVPALSVRAGIVIGAGSTSFEILRQTAALLLVQPVPHWLHSRVQPVAISDVVEALADALETDRCGNADLGGPDVLTYPELLAMYCEVADLHRLRVPAVGAPMPLVALSAGLVCAAPYWTAAALVHSLRHDMVCRPDGPFLRDPASGTTVREAIRLALRGDLMPQGLAASDPGWVQPPSWDGRIAGVPVPGATALSAAAHVVDHRLRGLVGAVQDGLRQVAR